MNTKSSDFFHCPLALKLALCVFLAVTIRSQRSDAASFSCSAATAPREKLICADPELSSADEKLAAAYKAALADLSEEGKAELRKSQRTWIRFTDVVCSTAPQAKPAQPPNASCLKEEYQERQKQLRTAVVKSAGLVIRRADVFKAAGSEPHDNGRHPNFTTTEIAYPQIDKPRDEGERSWNKLIAGEALAAASPIGDDDTGEDLQGSYELGRVSPAMISVMLATYDYPHGAAHGMFGEKGITWLLRDGRALSAEDVFDKKRAWATALARLVFDTAKKEEGDDFAVEEPAVLQEAAADPAHWLIREHSLVVRITYVELSLRSSGGIEAEIPWSALKPYLVAAPRFSIAPN